MLNPGRKSTYKRSANAAGLSETSVSPGAQRTRWNTTSRKDRAVARTLAAHGVDHSIIAKYIGFSTSAVTKIIKKQVYGSDDESSDCHYLDDTFRARYPEVATSIGMKRAEKKPKLEVEDRLPSITVKRNDAGASVSYGHVINHYRARRSSFPPVVRQESSVKPPLTTYKSRSKGGSSGKREDPINLDSDPPEVIEHVKHPLKSVIKFLSSLDHDLSGAFEALEAQDLGTPEKLFAIAGWPEDSLHRLFKEALPDITITQRFILIKGLKDYTVDE